jgi:hypothetical protein
MVFLSVGRGVFSLGIFLSLGDKKLKIFVFLNIQIYLFIYIFVKQSPSLQIHKTKNK